MCSGMLYRPKTQKPKTPIILMAHGFGAEMTFGLPAYAERFVKNGWAVFMFNYRGFGKSEGEIRNWVSPKRHLEDWRAALTHVRHLGKIDVGKIALWGSSFSGGHVMITAAEDKKVAAVLAQVPFVDGFSTAKKLGLGFILRATWHGIIDLMRMVFKKPPYAVSIVAPYDKFGVMCTPESYPGYMAIVDKSSTWQNQCPARILLTAPRYRPITRARKIKCPTLLIAGEKDSLIDIQAVRKAARRIEGAMLIEYEWGHFDIYHGKPFESVLSNQINFLKNVF